MSQTNANPAKEPPLVLVWDPFVRLFHWTLVSSVLVALVTGYILDASWLGVHIAASVLALALIFGRLVWGFLGTGYARFASFVAAPRTVLAYARQLRAERARRYLGHNPLGGAMIVALLLTLTGLGVTGVAGQGGALNTGPAAAWLSQAVGAWSLDGHSLLAALLLLLIAGHLGGVIFATLIERDPLVPAMLHGRKPARDGDLTYPSARPRVGWALAIAAVGLALATLWAQSGTPRPDGTVALADVPATVAEECSACHMLYPPSLMPAERWQKVMAGLDDHFGEDASLDTATTGDIADWYVAHAAGTADTRAAYAFAHTRWSSLSLTDTGFWRDAHEALSDAVFARKGVRSKANCVACHADAETGQFNPLAISVPKE